MSKQIDVNLSSVLEGTNLLKKLKENVKQSGSGIPEIKGSGETAQAVRTAAETFQNLENIWELLIDQTIICFEKMEENHRAVQEQLVRGMNQQGNK